MLADHSVSYPLTKRVVDGQEMQAYALPWANLYDLVERSAMLYPNKTGVSDSDRSITFAQLKAETDRLAFYFHDQMGIETGTHVGMLMVNSVEFCAAFFALMKLGAIAITFSTKLQENELETLADDGGIQALLLDSMWLDKARVLCETMVGVHRVLVREGEKAACGRYATFRAALAFPVEETQHVADDQLPAVIMYTSGTTGRPKGAVLTHFNLLQGAYAYQAAFHLTENERTVLSVPAFHITGLDCVMVLFVMLGAQQTMVPFFHAETVLKALEEIKATHIHAVATVFILLADAWQGEDLSSLRSALCGGGFISRESVQRFTKIARNVSFFPVYGMTETSGAGTYFPMDCLHSDIIDSAGVSVDNCQLAIMDEKRNRLPAGQIGEICFRGPIVIRRYLHAAQNENIHNGWLQSGDIGYIDQNGYIFIKDRIKDMINHGGEKIFSLEIEDALIRIPTVRQAAVFGVPDDIYGEVPIAVVVREGNELDADSLLALLRDRIAHYKLPKQIVFLDALPLTDSNKVKKNLLRSEWLSGALTP